MKELLMKEFKLTSCPLTFVFLGFAAMTLIPGYPILVGAFFICLGIFYTFQFSREYNDVLYTALLPVRKSDVVRARICFVVVMQMTGFLLCTILTLLRMTFLSSAAPYVSNPLMNANLVFLGSYLVIMTLFNVVFVTGFFKTAYNFGKPFIWFCIAAFLFIGVMETLHHLPGLTGLNVCGWEYMGLQAAVLGGGILLYVLGTMFCIQKSVRTFEVIDL